MPRCKFVYILYNCFSHFKLKSAWVKIMFWFIKKPASNVSKIIILPHIIYYCKQLLSSRVGIAILSRNNKSPAFCKGRTTNQETRLDRPAIRRISLFRVAQLELTECHQYLCLTYIYRLVVRDRWWRITTHLCDCMRCTPCQT